MSFSCPRKLTNGYLDQGRYNPTCRGFKFSTPCNGVLKIEKNVCLPSNLPVFLSKQAGLFSI